MSAAMAVTATFAGTSAGPVAAWSFDDGSGTVARDSSPNGNTGTLLNGPTWTTGRHGGALLFDGVDDRVIVSDSNSLDLTSKATLSAWVYPTAPPTSYRTILQKGTVFEEEVSAYYLFASGISRTGGVGNYPYGGGSPNGQCCASVAGPSVLQANTWTHVAVTYNGSRLRFYVNGVLVAIRSAFGPFEPNVNPLWIGGNEVYGSAFKGKLDDIRIYNRVLTQTEIQQEMGTGLPATEIQQDTGAELP